MHTENTEKPETDRQDRKVIFNMALIEVGKPYFPIMCAYQKRLVYMQHYLKLGSHTVRNFATRLRKPIYGPNKMKTKTRSKDVLEVIGYKEIQREDGIPVMRSWLVD